MTINDFKDKKVLILGLGLNQGGVGSARFFAQAGAEVRVTDMKTQDELKGSIDELKQFPNIEYVLGTHKNEDIDWADIVIRNPALRPDNPFRQYAEKLGKAETDLGIFVQLVSPNQMVGVTGTKGKSTTASLIFQILSTVVASGQAKQSQFSNVIFAGNIGKSVLDTIPLITPNTLIVLEISSFQLEGFDLHLSSPKWAVITNILPDHLNYYGSMQEYINAKKVIAKYQGGQDFLFIKDHDPVTDNPIFLKDMVTNVTRFKSADLPPNFKPTLAGEHNKLNYAAAAAVAKTFGIEQQQALELANMFKGVEFRQQLISEANGVKIINDTAATSPTATIAALQTFPNCILIAGGMNKNLDYQEMASEIAKNAKMVFFLEGEASDEIKKWLFQAGQEATNKIKGTYGNFEDLLQAVKLAAQPGDTVILSPGAASFNLFQNEFDRGRKFNEAVSRIF
jgi:UDP-N-acetylmuramoylalanine--D-glutamate ligase